MKICIFHKKAYFLCYLLFGIVIVSAFFLLVYLAFRFVGETKSSSSSLRAESISSLPVVVIDAGHGGEDCGAIGKNGIYEKDINLAIAEHLDELLRSNGVRTVMTRTEDILLYDKNSDYHGQKKVQDLATRRKIAESQENAVFISIHMNSFPDSRYSGLQVYYSKNASSSVRLAEQIQHGISDSLQKENNRKIKPADSNIYLLDRLSCPAVLVECGFLSNEAECERLSDPTYCKQMSLILCQSILLHLSESEKNPVSLLDFPTCVLYNINNQFAITRGNYERDQDRLYLFRM